MTFMALFDVLNVLSVASSTVGVQGFIPEEECRNPKPVSAEVRLVKGGAEVLTILECEGTETQMKLPVVKLKGHKGDDPTEWRVR